MGIDVQEAMAEYQPAFNCGGFATGRNDWYVPTGFSHAKANAESAEQFLDMTADQIEQDNPEWRRITNWRKVPKSRTLMAYRIEADRWEHRGGSDLHFLVRVDGKWWHKMGYQNIERVKFRVLDAWRAFGFTYCGKTAWFVRVDED